MKTTVEIHDALLERAKRYGKRTGRPIRALVEDGLRLLLKEEQRQASYTLPDASVGVQADANPLESYAWHELRELIYGAR